MKKFIRLLAENTKTLNIMNNLTKNKNFIFMLVCTLTLVITSSSCEKDAPKNCCTCTASTSASGENALSFDLDGVTWSPCDAVNAEGKAPEITAERYRLFGYDRITIMATQAQKNQGDNDNFFIVIDHAKVGNINPSDSFPLGSFQLALFSGSHPPYFGIYEDQKDLPFNLEVTRFDTINKIISGVFDCTLIEDNGGADTAKIKITNGRFDVRYN